MTLPAEQDAGERFSLPAGMREEIINHARQEAPRECCGIIAGRNGVPWRLYGATNVAPGNRLYEIDPAELIELEFRELPKHGAEIVAIYHSHPASEAYPSATDLELAFWPGVVYLICSLADLANPVVRGFWLRDGMVSEVMVSE